MHRRRLPRSEGSPGQLPPLHSARHAPVASPCLSSPLPTVRPHEDYRAELDPYPESGRSQGPSKVTTLPKRHRLRLVGQSLAQPKGQLVQRKREDVALSGKIAEQSTQPIGQGTARL